jgi:hypothetical protein
MLSSDTEDPPSWTGIRKTEGWGWSDNGCGEEDVECQEAKVPFLQCSLVSGPMIAISTAGLAKSYLQHAEQ